MELNPLQSCYDQLDHLNPFALYDHVDQSSGEPSADEYVPDEGEDDDHSNYMGNNTDSQFSTAIPLKSKYSFTTVINGGIDREERKPEKIYFYWVTSEIVLHYFSARI